MRSFCLSILALALGTAPASALERAAPPDAVKACPGHGPGFFMIPGTTTCIRIGGRVRAEVGTSSRRIARDGTVGSGASARLIVDSRTDTDYGPLRLVWSAKTGTWAGRDGGGPGSR